MEKWDNSPLNRFSNFKKVSSCQRLELVPEILWANHTMISSLPGRNVHVHVVKIVKSFSDRLFRRSIRIVFH